MKIKRLKVGLCLLMLGMIMLANPVFALEENTKLSIINGDNNQMLTVEEIKEMPLLEGWGGKMRSTGAIQGPFEYKGVSLIELCNLVGGMTPDNAVRITSRDGYAMTFSYKQVAGQDFVTYDPVSKKEVPSPPDTSVQVYQ